MRVYDAEKFPKESKDCYFDPNQDGWMRKCLEPLDNPFAKLHLSDFVDLILGGMNRTCTPGDRVEASIKLSEEISDLVNGVSEG